MKIIVNKQKIEKCVAKMPEVLDVMEMEAPSDVVDICKFLFSFIWF